MKLWYLALLMALCLCTSLDWMEVAGRSSSASRQARRHSLSRYVQQVGEAAEALARAPVDAANSVKNEDPLTQASAIWQSTWHSLADFMTTVVGSAGVEPAAPAETGRQESDSSPTLQSSPSAARGKMPFRVPHRQAATFKKDSNTSMRNADVLDEGNATEENEPHYEIISIYGASLYTDVTCNAPSVYAISSDAMLLCVIGERLYYLPFAFVCGLRPQWYDVDCLFTSAFGVRCVCPTDQFALYPSEGSAENVFCYPRLLDVKVQLPTTPLCYFENNAALGLPATQLGEYCIRTTRNGTISMQVLLQYDFGSTEEHQNYMDNSFHRKEYNERDASQTYYALNPNHEEGYSECMEAANLTHLRRNLFPYYNMSGPSGDFVISSSYNMSGQVTLFATIYQFTHPEEMAKHTVAFDASTYMLNANGTGTYTVQYDLSAVADSFIEGGRLYIEIGARSSRLLDQVRVARLHIDLEDWVPPPTRFSYEKDRSMLYFCIMVVALVSVVGLAFAVFWFCFKADDEDEDIRIEQVDRCKDKKTN